MTDLHDPLVAARLALACLDLTSLNDADTEADVMALCARADGPHGRVAAVCVWPRFVALARRELSEGIAVAAVANFPDGSADVGRAVRETRQIVEAGAQEVDLVMPFERLRQGDERGVVDVLDAVREACAGLRLKVILETGILREDGLVTRASQLALGAGADFLKTSTGKTAVSATPEAARSMLAAIAADPLGADPAGFKASGGIRNVADAAVYLRLCREALGEKALDPARFRIGASSLLNDIEAVLAGRASWLPSRGGY